MRVLYVASEATPWIKTGGLADVCGSLPAALAELGCDVRLLLPAYGELLKHGGKLRPVRGAALSEPGARLLAAPRGAGDMRTWLCELPRISDRAGNPYSNAQGWEWADNWARFGAFSRVATALAAGQAGLRWRPDIVHCHDWQTGLVPLLMMLQRVQAGSVFTVHNLHYRGLCGLDRLEALGLPGWLGHSEALEFHGQLAMIKGGLVFADRLTTVSPSYAREICTPEHGEGLDGLLRHRGVRLSGILNGIDEVLWNPATDPLLPARYGADDFTGKVICKASLQRELGLDERPAAPLFGVVSRLVRQKGIDLILAAMPALLARGAQFAILGSGDADLESALSGMAEAQPRQVAARFAFDEGLAHRIEAGADLFMMPSRFEPCGLNQMYSQRYGTPPIVSRTGGLGDSVSAEAGFVFDAPADVGRLLAAAHRALDEFANPGVWRARQRAGMARDFSWRLSAQAYLACFTDLKAQR